MLRLRAQGLDGKNAAPQHHETQVLAITLRWLWLCYAFYCMDPTPQNLNDALSQIQSMGITLPSPAYLVGALVFSLIGMAVYVAGKRRQRSSTKWLGLALMLYSYVAGTTGLLYLIGLALCAAVIWDWRRQT